MTITITLRELRKECGAAGFAVENILNSAAVLNDAAPLKAMGVMVYGPRGNRKCLEVTDGRVDAESFALWVACTDYATKKIAERRRT